MELALESGRIILAATEADILSHVEGELFVVLSIGPDSYIQCARHLEPRLPLGTFVNIRAT